MANHPDTVIKYKNKSIWSLTEGIKVPSGYNMVQKEVEEEEGAGAEIKQDWGREVKIVPIINGVQYMYNSEHNTPTS